MAIQFNNIGPHSLRDQGRTDATTGKDALSRTPAGQDGTREARDDVALSAGARHLQALAEEAMGQPAVDQTRVEEIRRAIAEGRYHVDPVRLAQKFLELEGGL